MNIQEAKQEIIHTLQAYLRKDDISEDMEWVFSLFPRLREREWQAGGTLSGGEKQRISIARAMLKNAPIVILDEATASVDPENEHLIQQALSALTKGKTILTIAHRLATIQHADQILVVEDGRIAQRGTHAELMAQGGLYRRFIEIREQAEGWRLA